MRTLPGQFIIKCPLKVYKRGITDDIEYLEHLGSQDITVWLSFIRWLGTKYGVDMGGCFHEYYGEIDGHLYMGNVAPQITPIITLQTWYNIINQK